MKFSPYTLNQLLKDFGRDVGLVKVTTSYNDGTGINTETEVTHSVRAYFYNDVPEITENSNITYGSKRAVLSGKLLNGTNTPYPAVQDKIAYVDPAEVNQKTVISKVSPIISNGILVCYLLHLED